jgi:uncharacterized protein YdaU (DUF1376 family)
MDDGNIPIFPLWTSKYHEATTHLTTLEHGAYLLLLMAMWKQGGSLPNDDVRLARLARLSLDRWRKIAPTIMEFFTVEDGDRITQKRLRHELEKSYGRMKKSREAGAAGGRAKALKTKKPPVAGAKKPVATPLQPEATYKKEKEKIDTIVSIPPSPQDPKPAEPAAPAVADAGGDLYTPEFDRLWRAYPRRDGNPKKAAAESFARVVRKGADPEEIIAGAEAFARQCAKDTRPDAGRFIPHTTTWINQHRWTDALQAEITTPPKHRRFSNPYVQWAYEQRLARGETDEPANEAGTNGPFTVIEGRRH